jgi:hypothetical protein
MGWIVEFTNEFAGWWEGLDETVQDAIDRSVRLLEIRGPTLPFPHSSDVRGSRHGNMRELRTQVGGEPYRTFYAFDPKRVAILLIGESKQGKEDAPFYEWMTPIADRLYDEHLAQLEGEARRTDKER